MNQDGKGCWLPSYHRHPCIKSSIIFYLDQWIIFFIKLKFNYILVYIARWTSVISEEVCDMGSYRTRRQPSVIRAHITHFFTYHTSPRVIYSLYHNNCPICLLFIEVLPKMSIKPSKTHEIKTWKITKYFCSVISYFGKTYHTLPQCDLDS